MSLEADKAGGQTSGRKRPGPPVVLAAQLPVVRPPGHLLDIPFSLSHTLFSMWRVLEHRRVARGLKTLPVEILKRYEKWKDIVQLSGPTGLRLIKGFRDEALHGEWKGHRSSRLGQQYRVIYRIEREEVLVEVVNLTAHDYRRK